MRANDGGKALKRTSEHTARTVQHNAQKARAQKKSLAESCFVCCGICHSGGPKQPTEIDIRHLVCPDTKTISVGCFFACPQHKTTAFYARRPQLVGSCLRNLWALSDALFLYAAPALATNTNSFNIAAPHPPHTRGARDCLQNANISL